MSADLEGRIFQRGEDGYEVARCSAVWNARTPERYPDCVVVASGPDDVVAAVRLARSHGWRIGVRSGGHSWAGNHVRDGGMLLDVSRLQDVSVDVAGSTAVVGPGIHGNDLVAQLAEDELFFPAGHCIGVGIGGYLLQGGYGWNGRVHGPACASVFALDVVTADGELVRADETQNPELLWAARGSGPGFFGVVVAFHVRVYPRPSVVANAVYLYPLEVLEEVFTWAYELGPRVPRTMELMLVVHRDENGDAEIAVTGPTLVDTEEDARAALALLETCPVLDRAKLAVPYVEAQLNDLYAGVHAAYPDEHRYVADNMWTHADVRELLPGLRRIAETMPAAPSHMLWMNWGPGATPAPERPDMAYSCEDDTYIAMYGVWLDEGEDAEYDAWVTGNMSSMEGFATGVQLADENLGRRPARFATDANMARLDELRSSFDPDGVFHPWMGRL